MVFPRVHPSQAEENSEERYRREAMGAFAHEVRTPLTSIRMVLELARREGGDDRLVLDGELASMLEASVDDLQRLADDLQETSRLERGRVTLPRGPAHFAAAFDAARDLLAGRVTLEGPELPDREGPWDGPHLARAIAGFAEAANRIGDGSGVVRWRVDIADDGLRLELRSGEPGGDERPVASDAGFSFFRSRQVVLAMGGDVRWERRQRYFAVTVTLPLA